MTMAKDNKSLHLVLKRKLWNMIASGEKLRITRILLIITIMMTND